MLNNAGLTTRVPLAMVLRRSAKDSLGHACSLSYTSVRTNRNVVENIDEFDMDKLDDKIRHGKHLF